MTRKLYSRKGTLLGTISYPNSWEDGFVKYGHFTFVACEFSRPYFSPSPLHVKSSIKTATITLYSGERGAVTLYGITPEEFEKLPGCSFSPGAGYIRSLVEGV